MNPGDREKLEGLLPGDEMFLASESMKYGRWVQDSLEMKICCWVVANDGPSRPRLCLFDYTVIKHTELALEAE